MAPDPQQIALDTLLDWNSLILAVFIMGVGYIGLVFLEQLKGNKIYEMPLFDKILRSSLLGFVAFSLMLRIISVNIIEQKNIIEAVGKYGVWIFILDALICVLFAGLIYLIFYFIPNVQIEIVTQKSNRKRK